MAAKYQDRKEYFSPAMAREDRESLTKEKRDSVPEYTPDLAPRPASY